MRGYLAALPFLILVNAEAQAADAWTRFQDPGNAFSAQVPATPAVSQDSVTNKDGQKVGMLEYTVDRGTSAIVMIVSDLTAYPDADAGKVIEGAVNGAKGSAKSVVSDTAIQLDGQAGRDVELIDNDGNHIQDRIFFLKGKLYQVMDVLPSAPTAAEKETARRFQKSFHFAK